MKGTSPELISGSCLREATTAPAVESTDDQMNRGRTEYRAPTRFNQAVKGAADQYLSAARPSY